MATEPRESVIPSGQPEKRLTEVEWARLATLIECEGCLLAPIDPRGGWAQPRITIVNTDRQVLEWAASLLDTKVNERGDNHDYRKVYHIQIGRAAKVLWILEHISPYLFAKRRQAILLFHVCTTRDKGLRADYSRSITEANSGRA